jgi:hypothetical protein
MKINRFMKRIGLKPPVKQLSATPDRDNKGKGALRGDYHIDRSGQPTKKEWQAKQKHKDFQLETKLRRLKVKPHKGMLVPLDSSEALFQQVD